MSSTGEVKDKLVLCVGICCLDMIHVCDEYPVENSDQRSKQGRWQRGGNPSNNCTVLALMDQPCEYLGCYSTDPMFEWVMDDFRRRGIRTNHCVAQDDADIPMSSVLLSLQTGSRTIVHCNANLRELTVDDFLRCDLNDYQWVHFEPRSQDVRLMMESVRKWNGDKGSPNNICVSLELEKPKRHNLEFAELCDVLFISQIYAEEHLKATNMEDAVRKARQMIQHKDTKIICAWGSEGAAALDNFEDTEVVTSPAFPPAVIRDTLGAGDTFCAAVIYALIHGKSLKDALKFGNQIAGAKIGDHGYDGVGKVYKGFLG